MAGLISLALLIALAFYLTCPVYKFTTPSPFRGDLIFNPYDSINDIHWLKANFQVQSRAWYGITDGRKNSNLLIDSVYGLLGYDIIATSDYQKINRHRVEEDAYIPVYEHGYGIRKNHQVLIGSRRVLWRDYPLFQNLHHKQDILRRLNPDNALIYIAHPKLRDAYTPEEMRFLGGYHGIEVLNNFRNSAAHWDAALSAGNYVTILGNDDSHNVTRPGEVGNYCTWIQAGTVSADEIRKALTRGKSYGMAIHHPPGSPLSQKVIMSSGLPRLTTARVTDDTVMVGFSEPADEILFIGQNAEVRKTIPGNSKGYYVFHKKDTYIRTEALFRDRCRIYLNPFCRYNGTAPARFPVPETDTYRTWIFRTISLATIIFILLNIISLRRRRNLKKKLHS